jgi:hypothetical protein
MEEEASGSDNEISQEGDQEDGVVSIFQAVANAALGQVHEDDVGERIDNLSRVDGRIVVLCQRLQSASRARRAAAWEPHCPAAGSQIGNQISGDALASSHQFSVDVTGDQ